MPNGHNSVIDTRLLNSFVCVAEELHFGRAAQRLHIAQPALSRQIKLLEQRLGVPLFHRTQRRVALTAGGRVLLERAYRIVGDLNSAVRDARRADAGETGHLSVGFIHSSIYSVTPVILGRFHQLFPDVELDLHELTIWDQIDALRDETIDVGILRPPVGDTRLQTHVFRTEHFLVAVPADHRLAGRQSIALRELTEERFVLFSQRQSPLFHSRIVTMCEDAGFIPQASQHAIQIHTVVGLVQARMGVAIVPEVARNFNMPGLHFLTIDNAPPPVHVALAWRRADTSSLLARFRSVTEELHGSTSGEHEV